MGTIGRPDHLHDLTMLSRNNLPARRLAGALSLAFVLSGCAVVDVAGAAAGAAVSVAGAVVSTGVKVGGKVVEKTIDVVTPGN